MPHWNAQDEAPSPYQYAALSQGDDVRLMVLLPGRHDDRIRMRIQHDQMDRVAFRVPRARTMRISDLQATLSDDWWVEETIDHRIIFYYGKLNDPKGWKMSWTHPDPAFDHSLYKSPEDDGCESMSGYEALSYTWGPPNPAEDVLVEGETPGQTRLSISPGLADALRHLRFPDRPRTLWVDAVCINQTEVSEKNDLVARMDSIYRYARRVVVWLGADNNNSALAFEALTHLGSQVQVGLTSGRWFTEPGLADGESECSEDNCRVPHGDSCPLPWEEATCRAVKNFLWRPWFSRVWVVQEILLANKYAVLQCGSHLMTWSVFRQAIVCLANKENLPALLPRPDIDHTHEIVKWNIESNITAISEMLVLTQNRQCADPRDFIYAMRGLLPPAFAARIQVRYGASVEKIYTDFILHHMQYTRRLLFLGDFRMRDKGGPERTPSWVPDFSAEIPLQYWHFSAGCSVSFATTNPARIGELRVLGRQCAVIDQVQPVAAAFLQRLLGSVEQKERDASARILAAGYLRERFPTGSVPTLTGWMEMLVANDGRLLRNVLEEGHDVNQDPNVPDQSTFMEDWARDLLRDRVFITTSEGHIGLGGPESRPGDRICVFLGCDAPIMLRTSEEGNDLFSVVGQCLVDGLEDACALLGPLPEGWRLQVFPENSSSSARCRFFHVETGRTVEEDPRLPDLDTDEWEILEDVGPTADDPFTFRTFRHIPTGDVVKSDPRMTPEALERRGVSLKTFVLQDFGAYDLIWVGISPDSGCDIRRKDGSTCGDRCSPGNLLGGWCFLSGAYGLSLVVLHLARSFVLFGITITIRMGSRSSRPPSTLGFLPCVMHDLLDTTAIGPRLDPTSISARVFRLLVLHENTMDARQDWSHVDLEAAGGFEAYLDSWFLDETADSDENEHSRWYQAMDGMPREDLTTGFQRFMASVQLFLEDKAIFYTTDRYIGIGPEDVQIGDELCVINNCHLPVFLRPEGPGHVLVGSVYVYGLSHNEPLAMLESGKGKLEKFDIH